MEQGKELGPLGHHREKTDRGKEQNRPSPSPTRTKTPAPPSLCSHARPSQHREHGDNPAPCCRSPRRQLAFPFSSEVGRETGTKSGGRRARSHVLARASLQGLPQAHRAQAAQPRARRMQPGTRSCWIRSWERCPVPAGGNAACPNSQLSDFGLNVKQQLRNTLMSAWSQVPWTALRGAGLPYRNEPRAPGLISSEGQPQASQELQSNLGKGLLSSRRSAEQQREREPRAWRQRSLFQ